MYVVITSTFGAVWGEDLTKFKKICVQYAQYQGEGDGEPLRNVDQGQNVV